ncbi:MAG: hypothetical protein O3A25_12750 [Acidobacteria bacterium]|nr:hypothetical protein [Acidobacteriota bacterium]
MILRCFALVTVALGLLCGAPTIARGQDPADDAAVMQALQSFLDGWNSRDVKKYAAALHFPHVLLENGTVRVYADEAEFLARGAAHWAAVQPEWDRTVWEERQIVQRLPDTVHVAGRWARLDKTAKVLSKADVLYVVVRKNGRWSVFTRSGSRVAQRINGDALE